MKPFNSLATLGGAAHNGFERWAGVGVFLEPWLGRKRTNILWAVVHPLILWRTVASKRNEDAMLAFNAGTAIAGAATHFVEFPWKRKFGFLPWLEEAEGMPPRLIPAYNLILWLWMIGGVGSLVRETRREHIKWVAAGAATGPLLLASARHHFTWAAEQAANGNPHFSEQFKAGSPRRPIASKGDDSAAESTS
jgi:hypothetical protein